MNLQEIREQFIEQSGRADLASTTDTNTPYDTDGGADWIINSGSRYLDLIADHPQQDAEWHGTLESGESVLHLPLCRNVTSVWAVNSSGDRYDLYKRTYQWLRSVFPKLDSEPTGYGIYWAPIPSRRAPSQYGEGGNASTFDVMIMPPASTDTQIEVLGLFHSAKLENNEDENYWSVNYPELLVLSGLLVLERFYRNTQGVNDYRESILDVLRGVDADEAIQGANSTLEMQG